MVIFMLLERRDLRDRLIGLLGHGHLAITTKAFDEAGTRVSRQLLMQSLVNLLYGIAAGAGLYFLGVPYPLVWAMLAAVLRFIPYVGPVLGAGAPILVSLAAAEGWAGPLYVVALFVVLELFTNLVLETVLYAEAAGVSPAARPGLGDATDGVPPEPRPERHGYEQHDCRWSRNPARATVRAVREVVDVLRDTGANLVASTLLETRTYLAGLVEIPRIPGPETNVAHAA
jgi:AI-2E family transporter